MEVGKDLPLSALASNYDAVLFAYGASYDRALGIPGEDLNGVYSARAFVGWYNGLPEYSGLAPRLDSSDTAVVIGHGNVALDVARTLLTDVKTLRKTDITEEALDALSKSRVRKVHVVGRRGPLQASFTVKEVRELMELGPVNFQPIPSELLPDPDVKLSRVPKRMSQLLSKHSTRAIKGYSKTWSLDFLQSPVRFHGSTQSPTDLDSVDFVHNVFVHDSDPFDGRTRIKATEKVSNVKTSLAFRSVGYKAEPLPGMDELGIQFDQASGTVPNEGGRVQSAEGHLTGLYAAGWVKSGPNGVIATTMEDAFATAEAIAADWDSQESTKHGWGAVKALIPQRVDWKGWLRIDAAELARGERKGKAREKFTRVEDMLQASE